MTEEKKNQKEKGLSLFHIDRALNEALENMVNPETGEINEDAEAEAEALKMTRTDKVFGCIRYIKNQRATAEAMKAEADRMAKRAKVFANAADHCEKYLGSLVDRVEDKGVECDAGALSWRKSEKVEVLDVSKLPSKAIKIERKPVAAEVKKLVKAGEIAPEVAKVSTNYNFKVK